MKVENIKYALYIKRLYQLLITMNEKNEHGANIVLSVGSVSCKKSALDVLKMLGADVRLEVDYSDY